MPDRLILNALPQHPSRGERIRAHVPELTLCLATVLLGAMVIIGSFFESFDPSPVLANLYRPTEIAIGLLMISGSSIWGKSLTTTYTYADTAWARIRLGSGLFAAGWLAFSVACILTKLDAVFPWVLGASLANIGYWYLRASIQNEKMVHTKKEAILRSSKEGEQ